MTKNANSHVLTSNIHFYTAASDRTPVLVFQDVELIGSGVIDEIINVKDGEITEDIIVIGGERYVRGSCTFTKMLTFIVCEFGVRPADADWIEISADDIDYVLDEKLAEGVTLAVIHAKDGKRYLTYTRYDKNFRPLPEEHHRAAVIISKRR